MKSNIRRAALVAAALALSTGTLAACGGSSGSGSAGTSSSASAGAGSSASSGKSGKIALLLPESKTARYEAFDKPLFEAKMKELCAKCEIVYSNATQDSTKQQQQAQSALTEGVKVIVLDPVDGKAAEGIVNAAKQEKVPVVAYDRVVTGVDYYVSFDNATVGKQQAQALVDKLKADGNPTGPIVMINGSPTDPNAALFKSGAMSVFTPAGVKILGAPFDTPDWSPDKAQQFMAGAVTQFSGQIKGVYAANDGTGGGAIAALKAANVSPLPPVTGQDAELAGIQRVVSGDQFMTIYKPIPAEANDAATAAYALLQGQKPKSTSDTNGIPSTLLPTTVVTADKVKDSVIKDGYWKVTDICTADYAAGCAKLGLS